MCGISGIVNFSGEPVSVDAQWGQITPDHFQSGDL
jgi:hypothetical protein